MSAAHHVQWPEKPYRGLNYFRPQDRPLLSGRISDVENCGTLLAHPRTRILLVHGATGCGKSSFLRAGLIPALEEQGSAYLFLKSPGSDDEALFIRCTDTPIEQISQQIFLFLHSTFEQKTPLGPVKVDLSRALLGAVGWDEFLKICREENGTLESLKIISQVIPQTLVLVVDQAEEVLTLNPSHQDFENRYLFFSFLREFQTSEFAARIILTIRTEFFGRFVDAIHSSGSSLQEFQHLFLGDLSENALIDAIQLPTSKQQLGSFGIPYEVYKFQFEDGLPQQIVADAVKTALSGPALPIIQLVCLGLFEEACALGEKNIQINKYTSKGGVDGKLIDHIRQTIQRLYVDDAQYKSDIGAIRNWLQEFYTMQDDGTVVARPHAKQWCIERLAGIFLHPSELLAALSSPQVMILREIRNVKPNGRIIDELTLGHDSVALALKRWPEREATEQIQTAAIKEKEYRSLNSFKSSKYLYVANIISLGVVIGWFLTDVTTGKIASLLSNFFPRLDEYSNFFVSFFSSSTYSLFGVGFALALISLLKNSLSLLGDEFLIRMLYRADKLPEPIRKVVYFFLG
ncbi:hypothetical protein ACCT07_36435 [Rhizobium johnstonii]|uniref:nSTAND1 domain-containing NTPase n=1 Tax=Rhizobium johnstonii TaxID=3019933 RepID=UPI003F980C6A